MTTPQDFDRLSAYLDNQLSPAEKAKLEARLAREPELKAALADLRMTVQALRSLPTVKSPRSFTLSPAQVQGSQRPRTIFPTLRLATALAALALVVVLVGDWGGGLLSGTRGAAAPALAPPALSTGSEQTAAATEALAISAAQESAGVTETPLSAPSAGGAEGAEVAATTAPASTEAPSREMAVSTEETTAAAKTADAAATPEAAILTFVATPAPPEAAPRPTSVPGETASTGGRATLAPTDTPVAVAKVGIAATSTEVMVTDTTVAASAPEAQIPAAPVVAPVRYLEVGLALLTVLLALAAWLTRK